MFATPAAVLGVWLRGLVAIAVIVGGGWLIYEWFDGLPKTERIERPVAVSPESGPADRAAPEGERRLAIEERPVAPLDRVAKWRPAADAATAMLVGGAALLLWSCLGQFLQPRRLWMAAGEAVPELPPPDSVKRVTRPDGTELHVEIRGPADAPTVVLTHGWGMSREEWAFLQRDWGKRFRTVIWDLPGLGKSKAPKNNDYRLEKLADDLAAVVEATSDGPVTLVGHSIGGMITLTLAKVRPEWLGSRIGKVAIVHSTYMNPLLTMPGSWWIAPLQKPLIEPLLYLQIALSPVVWLMNVLSYANGSMHSETVRDGFAKYDSRNKVDFVASYMLQDSPAVLARGSLGMLGYDARAALPALTIPTLVVSGEQDPVTSPEASYTIEQQAPNGRLWRLDPARHYGMLEHHKEFAETLAEFCEMGETPVRGESAAAVAARPSATGAPQYQ